MRLLILLTLFALANTPAAAQADRPVSVEAALSLPAEHAVRTLALEGPLAHRDAEISGMAWSGDTLVLLPQYPGRFAVGCDSVWTGAAHRDAGAVFVLSRAEIDAYLDATDPAPLRPRAVPFHADGVAERVLGFEGFEAIAFAGERAFLAVEFEYGVDIQGYLVAGTFGPDGLRLDAATLAPLPAQTRLGNLSYEALFAVPGGVVAMQEANGAAINPAPYAYHAEPAGALRDSLAFPTLEYRLTDVTEADGDGHFWAVNYFFPGDEPTLRPAPDSLALEHGAGLTHRRHRTVERLVELHHDGRRIVRTRRAPIQLELLGDGRPRNWEAIVRLGERGFLIATDKYPETILGFVPFAPAFETTE